MNIKIVALGLTISLLGTSCDSFENPNAASEEQVLTTVDGLIALAIGMKREYQTNSLDLVIRSSGLSAREFGVVVGFTNPQDLEAGGANVRADNGIMAGIWSSSYRVMAMAEDVIENTGDVVPEAGTRDALLAMGHLFKGIALGNLYMFWESFPADADPEGTAEFSNRTEALEAAIANLQAGLDALGGANVPASFQNDVLGTPNFDMDAVLNAYLARFHSFLGNHAEAIAAADRALTGASTVSEWTFEVGGGNDNPMYLETVQEPATYKPLDNFGIDSTEYVVPDEDGRKAFFLEPSDEIGESSRLPGEAMKGFFTANGSPIPVYLPGEMHLIKAEAHAKNANVGPAVAALNMVRTKTDDPWGVNAGLPAYDGPTDAESVLRDIYLNRRVELFLIGTSLEDSRRFERPIQSSPPDFTSYDRNRNFYPYPENERANNPNTPADPAI
jgi:hypothetical protein